MIRGWPEYHHSTAVIDLDWESKPSHSMKDLTNTSYILDVCHVEDISINTMTQEGVSRITSSLTQRLTYPFTHLNEGCGL